MTQVFTITAQNSSYNNKMVIGVASSHAAATRIINEYADADIAEFDEDEAGNYKVIVNENRIVVKDADSNFMTGWEITQYDLVD